MLAPRLRFEHGDVFGLQFEDDAFDLTVCRHVLHAVPHADRVVAELARVTCPGGRLHLIPEDYGMLHFARAALDPREFWNAAVPSFGKATGTDLYVGRHTYGILAALGLDEIAVEYVVVDPLHAPREAFAQILEAWRDGYADAIGELTPISREQTIAYFDQMAANVRDPRGYAVWMVPVWSARVR